MTDKKLHHPLMAALILAGLSFYIDIAVTVFDVVEIISSEPPYFSPLMFDLFGVPMFYTPGMVVGGLAVFLPFLQGNLADGTEKTNNSEAEGVE